MKLPARGLGRPLRCLILIATAGVVLAADNSWMTRLRFDFDDPVRWLSNFYATEAPSAEPAIVSVERVTTPTLSLDRLLNGLLFSQPATGWRLDPMKADTTVTRMAQVSGPIVQVNGSTLPAATFSSGFVNYSSAAYGPLPAAPTASG